MSVAVDPGSAAAGDVTLSVPLKVGAIHPHFIIRGMLSAGILPAHQTFAADSSSVNM